MPFFTFTQGRFSLFAIRDITRNGDDLLYSFGIRIPDCFAGRFEPPVGPIFAPRSPQKRFKASAVDGLSMDCTQRNMDAAVLALFRCR